MRTVFLAVAITAASIAPPAQAAPKVVATFDRPAVMDWKLGRVVLVSPQGAWSDCSRQILEKAVQMLAKHEIVAGPVDLGTLILQERIKLPTFLAASDVTALGKHIAADTLFLIRISQCTYPSTDYNSGHPKGFLGVEDTSKMEYRTTTRATLSGTLHLFDLKAGRLSKPLPLQATPTVTLRSEGGYPNAPPAEKIQADGCDRIVFQIEKLFFPWTEKWDLIVFDDKDCNLKDAYNLMKTNDFKGALELSRKNSEECKSNPKRGDKQKRHALHNVATALFALGDYEAAQSSFEEALRLGGEDEEYSIEICKARIQLRDTARQIDKQIAGALLTSS